MLSFIYIHTYINNNGRLYILNEMCPNSLKSEKTLYFIEDFLQERVA